MGNKNAKINKDSLDRLLQIKMGSKINDKWTSYLREKKILG